MLSTIVHVINREIEYYFGIREVMIHFIQIKKVETKNLYIEPRVYILGVNFPEPKFCIILPWIEDFKIRRVNILFVFEPIFPKFVLFFFSYPPPPTPCVR